MALSAGKACLSISSGNHRTSSTNEQALSFPVFLKYKSFPYLEEFSSLHSCLNKKHVVKRDFPKGKLRRLSKYNHSLAAIASEGESSQSTKDKDGQIETINFENVSKKFLVDEVLALKEALVAAENRAAAAERGRLEAAEALAVAEAKQQEYASSVLQNRDAAIAKAQAGNKALRSDLDKLIGEKSAAERNLSQANEDAIELALKAEKIAETALQQAMTYIEVDARLRIAEAETSAAEAALKVEERIRELSDNAAETVVAEAKQVLEGARNAADMIKEQARNVAATLQERLASLDNQVNDAAQVLSLQESVSSLERKLQLANTEIEKLKSALKLAEMRLNHANELVLKAEMKLVEFQKAAESTSQVHQENSKNALESLRTAALAREEAASSAFMNEVQALQDAFQAVQKAENVKEQATLQILEALKRSLAAAEASAAAWKKRAFTVQELLQKVIRGEAISDGVFPKEIPGGGRMMTVLGSDSKKWELLADGPRREIPDWMKRRIEVLQGLPPRLPKSSLTDDAVTLALQLPSSNEVWSIAKAKIKDDVFTKKAAEDEALAKQKRALEDALQMKTKRQTALEEAASGTGTGREIVFQGFNWESWRKRWYLELAPKAADLSKCGITTVWFPPPTESVAPQGYMPQDLYNLDSAYGTKEELKSCVAEMHKHDLLVLGDVVLNHRCASKQSPNGVYNVFGGKMAWGPEAIVRDDPNFQGRGNPSNGDIFHAAPNIDHSQDFVRRDIKEWLKWLRVEIGYDGWRLDFVRGFWGGYVKEYIEETKPAFAIGEYWDSLAYESGNICYNQDAHRQRIINWINATGGTSSAFDVTTKGILHSALHNEYWRLIDPRGKPPGVMGWWPSRAVTFLENHDTGSTQGHWPFPREKLMQGYAYILTHPGTPVIFYDHFYDFGLHDPISELIAARKRTGVHCRSPVKILHATGDGYVAQIGDNLVLKLGRLDWNPSKQHNLIGSWERSIDKGGDYQIWEKS